MLCVAAEFVRVERMLSDNLSVNFGPPPTVHHNNLAPVPGSALAGEPSTARNRGELARHSAPTESDNSCGIIFNKLIQDLPARRPVYSYWYISLSKCLPYR